MGDYMSELIKEFLLLVGMLAFMFAFAVGGCKILIFLATLSDEIIYKIQEHKSNKECTEEHLNGKPTLTFEQFISFYNISPEKFYCYDDYIMFLGREGFYFKTYSDIKKYRRWLKNREKSKIRNSSQNILNS